MAIIISKSGKGAMKVEPSRVDKESFLQEYVAANPDSLPLDDLKDDPRLLVVSREFATASGPIDVLAIDRDGDLYIIETKLFKNPDKRLVLSQMLDYGAALWKGYGNPDEFLAELDQAVRSEGGGLDKRLKQLYGTEADGAVGVRDAIKRNLVNGAMKFIVLMDRLDERLRNLILFVNQKSKFDIYAVEMEFYRHEGMEIVIPKLYGAEVKKDPGVSKPADAKYQWDEHRFLAVARENLGSDATAAAAVEKLLRFSLTTADRVEWKNETFKGKDCRAHVIFNGVGKDAVYSLTTQGKLALNFEWMRKTKNGTKLSERLALELQHAKLCGADWHDGVELAVNEWAPKQAAFEAAVVKVLKH